MRRLDVDVAHGRVAGFDEYSYAIAESFDGLCACSRNALGGSREKPVEWPFSSSSNEE
jgi:hypothetical protein